MVGQRLSPSECVRWFEAALTATRQLEDKEAVRKTKDLSSEGPIMVQLAESTCKARGKIKLFIILKMS